MATIHGSYEDRFKAVALLLQASITDGKDIGASIFVNINGKDVVDIWGGYVDETRTREWQEDTLVNVWSTTKTVTSLAALICIERGLLDPFEKIAKYWPEFAVNGKEDIEVRHLLSHASGLCSWAQKVKNVHERTACEIYTDFVHLKLGFSTGHLQFGQGSKDA